MKTYISDGAVKRIAKAVFGQSDPGISDFSRKGLPEEELDRAEVDETLPNETVENEETYRDPYNPDNPDYALSTEEKMKRFQEAGKKVNSLYNKKRRSPTEELTSKYEEALAEREYWRFIITMGEYRPTRDE